MLSAMRFAASGMQAASRRLDTAANDILSQTTATLANSAAGTPVIGATRQVDSSASLTHSFTDLVEARVAFAANAIVFQTVADMYQDLLDATDPRRPDDLHRRSYGVI